MVDAHSTFFSHDPTCLSDTLQRQRDSWKQESYPSLQTRLDRVDRCRQFLLDNQQAIVDATQADWIHKPADFIRAVEIIPVLNHAKHIHKHLKRWMQPDKQPADFPFNLAGAKTYVISQPIGVVGVMVPWNGPLAMVMVAAMDAFSAGNRVMAKVSELSPHTAEFMRTTLPQYFDETELTIITGELEVSRAFAELPFDHLMYTGGTQTAKHIMAAAARNLVPVTLELGGKCPVIVSPNLKDLDFATQRIMAGRLINTGQGCITPDYVLLPEQKLADFLDLATAATHKLYPKEKQGDDYAAIATQPHYERLTAMLDEVKSSGAEIHIIDVGARSDRRQLNPAIVVNPPDDLRVMREEIFGPILVVNTTQSFKQAREFVNRGARPLALYYFGEDQHEREQLLQGTHSGGTAINDVMMQLMMSSLPFGGIGDSGMGSYWGGDAGYKRFSHLKSVFEQGWYNKLSGMLDPPYGEKIQKLLKMQIR